MLGLGPFSKKSLATGHPHCRAKPLDFKRSQQRYWIKFSQSSQSSSAEARALEESPLLLSPGGDAQQLMLLSILLLSQHYRAKSKSA